MLPLVVISLCASSLTTHKRPNVSANLGESGPICCTNVTGLMPRPYCHGWNHNMEYIWHSFVQVKLSSEALTLTTGNRYFAIDCRGGTASTHSASVILKNCCNSKPSVFLPLSSTGSTYNSSCFFFKSTLVHYMKLKTSMTFKNHHKTFSESRVFSIIMEMPIVIFDLWNLPFLTASRGSSATQSSSIAILVVVLLHESQLVPLKSLTQREGSTLILVKYFQTWRGKELGSNIILCLLAHKTKQ